MAASYFAVVGRMRKEEQTKNVGQKYILISLSGGAGRFVFGPRQQLADLFIGRLREVFVPQSDGVKRLRREAADDLVHFAAKIVASLTRGDRDRHDD